MEPLNWLIPGLICLFVLGKIAEILRALRGSLEEDLNLLHASIADVRRQTDAAQLEAAKARQPIPDDALTSIASLLYAAEKVEIEAKLANDGGVAKFPRGRLQLRLQVKGGLNLVSQARSTLWRCLKQHTAGKR